MQRRVRAGGGVEGDGRSRLPLLTLLLCYLISGLLHLGHVGPFGGSLVEGKIPVDADQSETWTSRRLEVKGRVRYLKLSREPGLDDLSAHLFHVCGLQLQPD